MELMMMGGTDTVEVRDSTQRVLDVAEALFLDRGYSAITLRDIADELGIKQASLYYHFPAGKEQLFIAMTERLFERHKVGVEQALAMGQDLRAQLRNVARWFGSQPPLRMLAIMHADMPALEPSHVETLTQTAHSAVFYPLRRAFIAASERGEIRPVHPDMLAGSFMWLMDGLNYGLERAGANRPSREEMADELINLLMDGLVPR